MAISAGELEVRLRAQTADLMKGFQATEARLKALERRLNRASGATRKSKKSADSAGASFRKMAKGIGVAAAAYVSLATAQKLLNLSRASAQAQDSQKVFEGLGFSLDQFRESTKGLIDDTTLVQLGNFSQNMGITGEEFQKLALIADAAAKKTGQSQMAMTSSIITGTARSSKLILDNLGIMFSRTKALQRFADENKKSVKSLTALEQKQAEVNEVLRQGNKIVEDVASVGANASDIFDQMDSASANLSGSLGALANNVLSGLVEEFVKTAVAAKKVIDRFVELFSMKADASVANQIKELTKGINAAEESLTNLAMESGLIGALPVNAKFANEEAEARFRSFAAAKGQAEAAETIFGISKNIEMLENKIAAIKEKQTKALKERRLDVELSTTQQIENAEKRRLAILKQISRLTEAAEASALVSELEGPSAAIAQAQIDFHFNRKDLRETAKQAGEFFKEEFETRTKGLKAQELSVRKAADKKGGLTEEDRSQIAELKKSAAEASRLLSRNRAKIRANLSKSVQASGREILQNLKGDLAGLELSFAQLQKLTVELGKAGFSEEQITKITSSVAVFDSGLSDMQTALEAGASGAKDLGDAVSDVVLSFEQAAAILGNEIAKDLGLGPGGGDILGAGIAAGVQGGPMEAFEASATTLGAKIGSSIGDELAGDVGAKIGESIGVPIVGAVISGFSEIYAIILDGFSDLIGRISSMFTSTEIGSAISGAMGPGMGAGLGTLVATGFMGPLGPPVAALAGGLTTAATAAFDLAQQSSTYADLQTALSAATQPLIEALGAVFEQFFALAGFLEKLTSGLAPMIESFTGLSNIGPALFFALKALAGIALGAGLIVGMFGNMMMGAMGAITGGIALFMDFIGSIFIGMATAIQDNPLLDKVLGSTADQLILLGKAAEDVAVEGEDTDLLNLDPLRNLRDDLATETFGDMTDAGKDLAEQTRENAENFKSLNAQIRNVPTGAKVSAARFAAIRAGYDPTQSAGTDGKPITVGEGSAGSNGEVGGSRDGSGNDPPLVIEGNMIVNVDGGSPTDIMGNIKESIKAEALMTQGTVSSSGGASWTGGGRKGD